MINVILYLDNKSNALQIVQDLLANKLIVWATIDLKKESYYINENVFSKEINDVVTCQTEAVLFFEIEDFISKYFGSRIRISSSPIIASNATFKTFIKSCTNEIQQSNYEHNINSRSI